MTAAFWTMKVVIAVGLVLVLLIVIPSTEVDAK